MSRWKGQVAVVTGAARGIGAATARLLVEKGMKVAGINWATDFEHCEALADSLNKGKSGGYLLPVQCDISKEEQVLDTFKQIRKEFGKLHVCVNAAGVLPSGGDLIDGDTNSWKRMLDVNILGLSLCTREAIRLMREGVTDNGHVIHIGSYCGHRIPPASYLHFYAGTKHAVKAITEGLRLELRSINSSIRISSISPGAVKTQFGNSVIENLDGRPDVTAEDVAELVFTCLQQPRHVQIIDMVVLPTEQSS